MNRQLPPSAIAALQAGNSVEAIKLTRKANNLGLKEAKDLVEAYMVASPAVRAQMQAAQSRAGGSLLGWVVMMILVIATVVYFWPE